MCTLQKLRVNLRINFKSEFYEGSSDFVSKTSESLSFGLFLKELTSEALPSFFS